MLYHLAQSPPLLIVLIAHYQMVVMSPMNHQHISYKEPFCLCKQRAIFFRPPARAEWTKKSLATENFMLLYMQVCALTVLPILGTHTARDGILWFPGPFFTIRLKNSGFFSAFPIEHIYIWSREVMHMLSLCGLVVMPCSRPQTIFKL